MPRTLAALLLACLPFPLYAAEPPRRPDAILDRLEARTYRDADGRTLLYRLHVPKGIAADAKVPLVLFLHGAGGRGDDNRMQVLDAGAPGIRQLLADDVAKEHPCFIVVPQVPRDRRWVEVDWGAMKHEQPKEPSEPMRLTIELLAALQKEFPAIDARRLYVTGLSMGGYGTWDLIARHPGLFAAAIPVCGGGDEATAPAIKGIPVWAFHGGKDTVVRPERSRNMVAALKAAGGEPKYTEYDGVGHDSWVRAYAEPGLWDWLFAQKRP